MHRGGPVQLRKWLALLLTASLLSQSWSLEAKKLVKDSLVPSSGSNELQKSFGYAQSCSHSRGCTQKQTCNKRHFKLGWMR